MNENSFGITINEKAIYTDKDVMMLLGVKDTLLRKYRDEGYITYRQVDGSDKRWYLGSDVLEFLNNNMKKSYRYDAA